MKVMNRVRPVSSTRGKKKTEEYTATQLARKNGIRRMEFLDDSVP
jgi:hypothetical protein